MNCRPLAVKLIATYVWLKATVLIGCVLAARLHPSTQPMANQVIEGFVPIIMAWREPSQDIWLAPLFALGNVILGAAIWGLKRWARTVTVTYLALIYGKALVGLTVALALDPDKNHFQKPSVYFEINAVASLIILAVLCGPDVRRAFGIRA